MPTHPPSCCRDSRTLRQAGVFPLPQPLPRASPGSLFLCLLLHQPLLPPEHRTSSPGVNKGRTHLHEPDPDTFRQGTPGGGVQGEVWVRLEQRTLFRRVLPPIVRRRTRHAPGTPPDGYVPSEASTDLSPPPPLRLLPAGATRRLVRFAPTENRRLFTAHSFFTTRVQLEDHTFLKSRPTSPESFTRSTKY